MNSEAEDRPDPATTRALQTRLDALFNRQEHGVALMLYSRGGEVSASCKGFSPRSPVSTGCLAKILLGVLVTIAYSESKIRLEDTLGGLLDLSGVDADLQAHLRDVQIGHLLNHTCGVESSFPGALKRDGRGFISAAATLESLGSGAVFGEPGTTYHYSNIGAWMTAAVLERLYASPYGDLLKNRLFAPLGLAVEYDSNSICPGKGGSLRLSAADILQVGLLFLHEHEQFPGLGQHFQIMRGSFAAEIPHWPVLGKRTIPLGIDFGDHFGHFGFGVSGSSTLRIFPERGMVLVSTSQHEKLAGLAIMKLFEEMLGSHDSSAMPARLASRQWKSNEAERYCGEFRNNRFRMRVDVANNGQLRATLWKRESIDADYGQDVHVKRYLVPAEHGFFFPAQPERSVIPFLQFLKGGKVSAYRYIRAGRHIFQRA